MFLSDYMQIPVVIGLFSFSIFANARIYMKLDERKEQRRMYNFECNFESSFTGLIMVLYVVVHFCNIVWKKIY